MVYTISDFCHMYEDEVRLIAGWGGMTRKIENVGILDYEMVRMSGTGIFIPTSIRIR